MRASWGPARRVRRHRSSASLSWQASAAMGAPFARAPAAPIIPWGCVGAGGTPGIIGSMGPT